MNKRWILIPIACFSLIVGGWADAQGTSRLNASGKGARIDRGNRGATHPGAGLRRAPEQSGAASRHSTPMGRGRNRDLNNTGGRERGPSGMDSGPLGDLLGQYLAGEYGGHRFDPYEVDKARADAYRDAAIANAIVNVVGILAASSQPQVPVALCPPPSAPRGHIERQRVLIQEGRTEEYQVWIPEYTIVETGELVVGHYETRRRAIAPVYEEREIWVPSP